ncbi:alpha-E domain-containing protein [Maridesulfovibrio sp.]|uniref:alpha-E domain-containing protein n=1 Tax=Maridesulfovibrio sp. TaxID=2795000 RepID=UPI002A18E8B6|nr:alpha-E domain-containing protein [Maridesulfovibrio sp.]
MLSRVADAVYWMSRYLERAVNLARIVDVNWLLTLDMPEDFGEQWEPLVATTGDRDYFFQRFDRVDRETVLQFLLFDTEYMNSIRSCLRMARENARTIREMIPSEMWEEVNIFYHMVERAAENPEAVVMNPFSFCNEVKRRGFILGGISAAAMPRDEAFYFTHMGRMLERADKTTRLLDVKYFLLLPKVEDVNTTLDHIQWNALLKAASGFQAYSHRHGLISPDKVVDFLLLDHDFPRSSLHCLTVARNSMHQITGRPIGHFSNMAEKVLGQLVGEMSFHDLEEIIGFGLHEFTDNLQTRMNKVDTAIAETFFSVSTPLDSPGEQ